MGLVATASPYSRRTCETQNTIPWKLKVWVCLQAVLSAVRLYVSYAMLAYLPLGDAVTIMFVEPLFTLVFSFLFLRLSASLWRILLCFGLLLGMVFTVQPPFVFGRLQVKKIWTNILYQIAISIFFVIFLNWNFYKISSQKGKTKHLKERGKNVAI